MDGSKRPHVLVIPSWYPSPNSPINGVFIREQARALARRMQVGVLTPRFPSLADQVRLRWGPAVVREDDRGVDTWKIRKLKIPTLRRFLPFLHDPDHVFVYYRKFAAAIRAGFTRYVQACGQPDLIHAHVVFPAGWIALELGKQTGIPVVLTEHSGPFSMHLATPRQQTLARTILRGVQRCIAVSAALRRDMHAVCPEAPIDVVPNLVDTDFFVPAATSPSDRVRLLFVGRLDEAKGVQFLLQALATLPDRIDLCIGGDGPYRRTLERLATSLHLTHRCRFAGLLNRDQVRAHMQACDVFVLPSLGETFGIVLGEAMACGKPVLATRCGGPEEVVTQETGMLVMPANPHELASALISLAERQHTFHADAIRANVVRRYGPASFVERMTAVFDEMTGEARLHRRAG